jgi:predicted site-specific integrase-resolvase
MSNDSEKIVTVKQAAEITGLPAWKIRRAVKAGLIPAFTLLNTRLYLHLKDIYAALSIANGNPNSGEAE